MNTMYKIKKLTNVGNPDFRQDPDNILPGTAEYFDIVRDSIDGLRAVVSNYINRNELGGGNFTFPTVYKDDEPIGFISYNLKFKETDDIPSFCS
jgi:hypothetical protein